jgi:hypothetical protein
LICGLIGLWLFKYKMAEEWIVLLVTGVLLIVSVYTVEGLGRLRSKRGENKNAT